jgi:hypothetical protein
MFLRHKLRRKDGKDHRYWSVVENRRVSGGRTVQRHVFYPGEINDSQRAAWCQTLVTPDGLALAYEVMPGKTSDKTTLRDFLQRIEARYGKAGRIWVRIAASRPSLCWPEMRAAETPDALSGRHAAWAVQSNGDGLPGQVVGAGS